MHQLGDQWIEIIDGQEHMVKAVHPLDLCQGCLYNGNGGGCLWDHGLDDCEAGSKFIVKDLGIVNEDGCLPNCWGEYPRVECLQDMFSETFFFECVVRGSGRDIVFCTTHDYPTKQEAIDAWNRRG